MPAIYDADCFCDSCADEIRKRLNPNDLPIASEDEYDSCEYPKWMEADEASDCPQHCGSHADCLEADVLPSGHKVGKLLSRSLTADGEQYVIDAILAGGEVSEFWKREFDL